MRRWHMHVPMCLMYAPTHTHTYPHTPACRHAWLASSFHQVDGCSVTIPIPFGCSHLNHAPPDSIRQSVSPSVRQSVCLFLSCRTASPSVRKIDNTSNNENTPSVFISFSGLLRLEDRRILETKSIFDHLKQYVILELLEYSIV